MIRRIASVAILAVLVGGISGTGAASAVSTNLFAVVRANGGLNTGNGVTGVTHIGTGQYEVTFSADVSDCAYVATTRHAYSQAIQAYTAGGHLSSNGVYVEIKNQGGGLIDGPFHLVVACGTAGIDHAVIGYDADLVRSSGASLAFLGSGRYEVSFERDVSSCAYLATVGDPGRGLVFAPSGVYTGSGSQSDTVYVETKNPGGGLQDGVPFHLAVICPDAADVRVGVVASDGIIERGSPLTSSFLQTTGQYKVVTNLTTTSCATIATRGSVDTDVPFSPATVEIRRGPASNTVGVEVRTLLFFGGDLLNEEFHTAIVC